MHTYDIPRWYRAYHWCDEPYFSKAWLSQIQVTALGGSHAVEYSRAYTRLSQAEIWFDLRQNFTKGFFTHIQLPWSWQRIYVNPLTTRERSSLVTPSATVGYTLNYEDFLDIDFIDMTVQMGCIFGSPRSTITAPIPRATSTSPAFLVHGAWALGFVDWATIGNHIEGVIYSHHALYSASIYAQADHIIPTLSLTGALTLQGQSGIAHTQPGNYLCPWYMLCFHTDIQVDTCTDDHPSRPYFHGFVDIPLTGKHIIGTTIWGGALGLYLTWSW